MFSPLESRPSAVDTCAQALRRAIMGGELAPGARLPPERALAEQFRVNRVTVRGALARLASSHLLSVRQGSGYVVRDFRDDGGPDLISGLVELASSKELADIAADLLLVRRHLAGAVLQRLSSQRSVDVESVVEAVAVFEAAVARGGPSRRKLDADVAIVTALVDATRSAVLRLVMNPIQRVLGSLPILADAIYRQPSSNAQGWKLLVGWLDERSERGIGLMIDELARRDEVTVSWLRKRKKK